MRNFCTGAFRAVLTSCVSAAIIACSTIAIAKTEKPKPPQPFAKPEELLAWVNGYRLNPEPKRLPAAIKAMQQFGLTKDMDQAGVYIGFTAGVIGSNPQDAEALVASCFPLPPTDQVLLIKAIAYSGLADWKELMIKFVERMPARKVLIDKYLFGNKPVLADLPMGDDSTTIDINWGYYFATGSEAPIRRIVSAVAWTLDRNEIEKLTIGAMAKWTLAQNASRDADLLAMLKSIAAEEKAEVRAPLHEVMMALRRLSSQKSASKRWPLSRNCAQKVQKTCATTIGGDRPVRLYWRSVASLQGRWAKCSLASRASLAVQRLPRRLNISDLLAGNNAMGIGPRAIIDLSSWHGRLRSPRPWWHIRR